jgi:putative DNA primase/helicase
MSEITHGVPLSFADVNPVKEDTDLGELISPRFSEDNLALLFSKRYGDELLYVPAWGTWLRWDGCRYKPDDICKVWDSARKICREESAECEKEAITRKLNSAATRNAVENLARSDQTHVRTPDQFDADTWSLNTPGGCVNLRTGELLPHHKRPLVTKMTAITPGGECPLFLKVLQRVTGENPELIGFIQRVLGYCLTGSTGEQALFFIYGTGQNGKGTTVNTIQKIMGDYAQPTPIETLTESKNDRHPTELACMRGARLVSSSETERGRAWAESRIKLLTGGDPIQARFMRGDFFQFQPQFKLIIFGNNKPTLRSVDPAIRRRMNLIPFEVKIPDGERDRKLDEKLVAEWPGILQWAIDGCLAWQRDGLNPPKVVLDATAIYLAGEDKMGRYLEDRCLEDKTMSTNSTTMFRDFKAWCEETGERLMSHRRFTQALEERGIKAEHTRTGNMLVGIALKSDVA